MYVLGIDCRRHRSKADFFCLIKHIPEQNSDDSKLRGNYDFTLWTSISPIV
jgi:hypothetical protein